MKSIIAVEALSALAQEHRLQIFRLLVKAGRAGAPAGTIGKKLRIPLSTLSFHLKELKQAKLIDCRREGRTLFYSAGFKTMNALMAYLMENCCQGEEDCGSLSECG